MRRVISVTVTPGDLPNITIVARVADAVATLQDVDTTGAWRWRRVPCGLDIEFPVYSSTDRWADDPGIWRLLDAVMAAVRDNGLACSGAEISFDAAASVLAKEPS